MFWPMIAVALGFLGVAVLGVFAVRVHLEVGRLARQVNATSADIARAADDLERAAVVVAKREVT